MAAAVLGEYFKEPRMIKEMGTNIKLLNAYIAAVFKIKEEDPDITENTGLVGDLFQINQGRAGICAVGGGGGAAAVQPFCAWMRKQALGRSNDCLIHSFLTVTCENFRKLTVDQKIGFADQFRRVLLPILIDMPLESRAPANLGKLRPRGKPELLADYKKEAVGRDKLSDAFLGILCESYGVRCLLIQTEHVDKQVVNFRDKFIVQPPAAYDNGFGSNAYVIVNNVGAHFEGVMISGGVEGAPKPIYRIGGVEVGEITALFNGTYPIGVDPRIFNTEGEAREFMIRGIVAVEGTVAPSPFTAAINRLLQKGQIDPEVLASFRSLGQTDEQILRDNYPEEYRIATAPVPAARVAAPVPVARVAAPVPVAPVPAARVGSTTALPAGDVWTKKMIPSLTGPPKFYWATKDGKISLTNPSGTGGRRKTRRKMRRKIAKRSRRA